MTEKSNTIRKFLLAALVLCLTLTAGVFPLQAIAAETTDNTKATVTFTAGELKLESVPVLDFGTNAISHMEEVYKAVTAAPDVQISDLRGSGNGWDLYVSLSPFTLDGSSTETLNAASIRFTSPTVNGENGNAGTPPTATPDIKLTSDNTQTPVLKAGNGEGMGVWSLHWDTENTTLTVKPGTAEQGKSVATLTWSLQSTP